MNKDETEELINGLDRIANELEIMNSIQCILHNIKKSNIESKMFSIENDN